MANSSDNVFTQNDFLNNSFDIATNSRQNFSTFNKNYWSKYQGYDLDKNKIGDVPYHPVKLYSIIAEQQQPAIILLHSLFIEVLDIAESIFPALTPENLVDNSPLMRRVN
jgi:nitrous oxidase accessory protein